MSPTVLPPLNKMSYGVPRQIRALLFLREARHALQRRDNAGAAVAAEEGKLALKPLGAQSPVALEAALGASLATAKRRQESTSSEAQEHFDTTVATFVALLETKPTSVVPFLRDYLTMLNEFAAFERSLELAEKLQILGKSGSAPSISLASISPSANSVLALADSLRNDGQNEAASEMYLHTSGLALAAGEHPLALAAVEGALSLRSGDPQALRMHGLLQWQAGKVTEACLEFEQAAEADPEDVDVQLSLAHAQITGAELRAALATAAKVRAVDVEQPSALFLQGEAHRLLGEAAEEQGYPAEARGHWQAADVLLVRALRGSLDARYALQSHAITLYRLKEFGGAFQELTRSLECDPGNVDGNGWLADVLMKLGRATEALEASDVALTLLAESSEQSEARVAWLLGIKGRALTATGWTQQATTVFEEAVRLQPQDNFLSTELLDSLKRNGEWEEIARFARALQENPYDEPYLLFLRTEEVNAHRNLGNYEDAFSALKRTPLPLASSAELVWPEARLLADIGNFEDAEEVLCRADSEAEPHAGHLGLRGWAVQNLEPENAAERKALATQGSSLYQTALNLLQERAREKETTDAAFEEQGSNATRRTPVDVLWYLKGLANAKLRLGAAEEALVLYRQVVEQCVQELPSPNESARVLALTGWCHHCMGEPKLAARYYEAAMDKGGSATALLFDHALVLAALPGGERCLEAYRRAVAEAQQEGVLRRVGLCRVALHDLREVLFRAAAVNPLGRVAHTLCVELLDAAETIAANHGRLVERIFNFLDIVIKPPVEMETDRLRSVQFGIKAARAALRGDTEVALEAKHEIAHLYSQMDEPRWAAKAWRELHEAHKTGGRLELAFEAAQNALRENLYGYDPEKAGVLIAFVTHCVADNLRTRQEYEMLIREMYLLIGPERAFLDAHQLITQMPSPDTELFVTSVLRLFPPLHWDERWLYLQLGEEMLRVPNSDAVQSPFNPYRKIGTFREAQKAVLETVV